MRAAEAAAALVKGAPASRSKKPKAGSKKAHLDDLAARLGDRLDTHVRIALGASKGQIIIDFATVADLNRIADELGVERN